MSRRSHSSRVAAESMRIMLAAPEVVAYRLARLWLAMPSPSHRDHRELYLMGSEKIMAFQEAWNAMMIEMYRSSMRLMFSPAPWLAWSRNAMAITGKGLVPIRRRVRANATRLRRRGTRLAHR